MQELLNVDIPQILFERRNLKLTGRVHSFVIVIAK